MKRFFICVFAIFCLIVSSFSAYSSESLSSYESVYSSPGISDSLNSNELMADLYIDGLHIFPDYGEEFINRDGVLYVPVRSVFDIAQYLTEWNEKTQTVILYAKDSSGKAGLKINSNKMYTYINGEHEIHILPNDVIMENDMTYIPVISVCEALGFDVRYGADINVISVNTYDFKDYAYDEWAKYRIASPDDIKKDEYITNTEAIRWFSRLRDDFDEYYIKSWYRTDDFAPLDDIIDDELKCRIMIANVAKLINDEEILSTDFNARLTNYEALRYAIRDVPDVGGCIYDFEEYYYTDKEDVYVRAFCKGLIDTVDYSSADEPIRRQDFYNLMYKTMYIRHYTGGYGGAVLERNIDYYLNAVDEVKEEPKSSPEIISTKIDVDYTFDDNINISWTLPDSVPMTDDIWFYRTVYAADGSVVTSSVGIGRETQMKANELIGYFAGALPDRPDYIRCTFGIDNEDNKRTHEWYFDIDLSQINVELTGKKIATGTYKSGGYSTNPLTGTGEYSYPVITLAEGYDFIDGAYYVIESYDKSYRKDEYNLHDESIFVFNDETKISDNTFSGFMLGTPYTDEMHLREIIIEGSAQTGFSLKISSESEECFEVLK